MNEALIKKLIKHKLDLVNSIIDSLPEKISQDAKDLRKVILDSVNESFAEAEDQSAKKSKAENKLENVTIE